MDRGLRIVPAPTFAATCFHRPVPPNRDTTATQVNAMGRFSRMLHSWLRPHFLDVTFLARAQERYAAFLELHADNPEATLVPTADIALVWHAHMALSGEYSNACREMYGKEAGPWGADYLHVTDPAQLVVAYGETKRLYEKKYGK
jgi:hypothetical protein